MRKKILFIIFIILLICTAIGINYLSIAAGENWSVGPEIKPGHTYDFHFGERAKEAYDSKDQTQTFFNFNLQPWLNQQKLVLQQKGYTSYGQYCIDPHTKPMVNPVLSIKNVIDVYPQNDRIEVWNGPGLMEYDNNAKGAAYEAGLPIVKAMAYAAEKSCGQGEVGDQTHWKLVLSSILGSHTNELINLGLNASFTQVPAPTSWPAIAAGIQEAMNGSKDKSYRARFLLLNGATTQDQIIFCAIEAQAERKLTISKLGLVLGESEANGKKLANVGFTLQYLQEGEHNGHYVNIDENGNAVFSIEPITLRTNGEGKIEIKNLPEGRYTLTETDLPYDEYKPSGPIEVNYAGGSQTVTVKNYGDQPTSSAGGYVWEDNPSTKSNTRNNLRSAGADDNKDKDLSNVKVTVYHENGGVLGSTSTSGGNYRFSWQMGEKELKEKYGGKKGYRIEFEYNGLTYEAVSPNPKNSKGSEATEDSGGRARINNNFSTIENNRTRNRNFIKL